MNIKQLRLFSEIVTTGKISVAAQRLNFSQPAASKMLYNLEDYLGFKLFSRTNGGLHATPEALALHSETLGVLQHIQRLEDSFSRAKHGQLGKLSIATIFGPSYSFLPELLGEYARSYEELRFNLQVLPSSTICDQVASGQSELGLADKSPASNRFDTQSYFLPCYCAIHSDHDAAKEAVLTPHILDGQSWITFDPQTYIYSALKDCYNASNASFEPRIEVSSSFSALSFVEQNSGVSMIDAINKHSYQLKNPDSNILFRRFEPNIVEPLNLLSSNCRPLSMSAQEMRKRIDFALNKIIDAEYQNQQ